MKRILRIMTVVQLAVLISIYPALTGINIVSVAAREQSEPLCPLYCGSAILIEWDTGTILVEKNGYKRMYPASLTKMMTALIALEKGRLEDIVTISYEAAMQPGSSMYLKEGDKYYLEDLLYGLLLNSGNDAAWAIAEQIGGSPGTFFSMMNERARSLGAVNTRFENPHGLNDINHYTTAYDLALIARTCLRHPMFRKLVSTREREVEELASKKKTLLENTNRLLWSSMGVDGVKTGTTEAAGQCLVASVTKGGMKLLAVILDSYDRWQDAVNLLEWGFRNFRVAYLACAGETLLDIPCIGAFEKTVPVVLKTDLKACVPRYSLGIMLEVDVPRRLNSQIPAGTVIGQATVYLGNRIKCQAQLVTGQAVNKKSPVGLFVRLASWLAIKLASAGIF
jgi:D-alanyl-D-alanine carboxypeptidase (penicillin-binding protein 5/6)